MIVISDNSALSCLAELGELDLLRQLYGTVTITTTVLAEALHGGAPVALQQLAANPPPWVAVLPDMRPYLPETIRIEDGEASSITLAWQHRFRSLLIMD